MLDADAMAGDSGFATAGTRRNLDVLRDYRDVSSGRLILLCCLLHISMLPEKPPTVIEEPSAGCKWVWPWILGLSPVYGAFRDSGIRPGVYAGSMIHSVNSAPLTGLIVVPL